MSTSLLHMIWEEKNKASKSITFYNKKLRTGNEMFLPQEITDILLDSY